MVNNNVVKKTVYDKLVAKVNNIDTSRFVLKIKYDTDKSNLEKLVVQTKKFLMLVDLLKKTDYNSKITKIESKIPSVSGLATDSASTAAENKIPNVTNLVKKADYDAKISGIEKKFTDHYHDRSLLQNLS